MELLISYRKQRFQQTRLVLFAAAAFFSCPAMAQETTVGQGWFDQDTMTGNWDGDVSRCRRRGSTCSRTSPLKVRGILPAATIRPCVTRSKLTSAPISTSSD